MTAVEVQRRVIRWVDLVGDLLLAKLAGFPVDEVLSALHDTFHAQVAWFWSNPDASFGFHMNDPVADWPTPDDLQQWANGLLDTYPLVCWYATTGDLTSGTLHRAPRSAAPASGSDQVHTLLGPVGRQLSIPYQLSENRFRSFLVCGTDHDFDDESVELARRIQPMLVLLARQTAIAECRQRSVDLPLEATHPLTGREQAVLQLLSEGHTATSIGRRLGISTRTVHVHLAHVYRKLGVNDRLRAVNEATQLGYLNPIRSPRESGLSDTRRNLQVLERHPDARCTRHRSADALPPDRPPAIDGPR